MDFSRIFWSAASFLSMSAHCARGIFQNPTYEYIGGFSLTSGICAPAGAAQTAAIASAHSPAKTLPNFLFIIFILLSSQDFHFAILCHGSVHLGTRIWGCATLRGARVWRAHIETERPSRVKRWATRQLPNLGRAISRNGSVRHGCDAGQTHSGKRSEEHTSELQSPCNLVCRLLLEKKKKKTDNACILD